MKYKYWKTHSISDGFCWLIYKQWKNCGSFVGRRRTIGKKMSDWLGFSCHFVGMDELACVRLAGEEVRRRNQRKRFPTDRESVQYSKEKFVFIVTDGDVSDRNT